MLPPRWAQAGNAPTCSTIPPRVLSSPLAQPVPTSINVTIAFNRGIHLPNLPLQVFAIKSLSDLVVVGTNDCLIVLKTPLILVSQTQISRATVKPKSWALRVFWKLCEFSAHWWTPRTEKKTNKLCSLVKGFFWLCDAAIDKPPSSVLLNTQAMLSQSFGHWHRQSWIWAGRELSLNFQFSSSFYW